MELSYLRSRRQALGGYVPARRRAAPAVAAPALETYALFALHADGKKMSTTMAAVRFARRQHAVDDQSPDACGLTARASHHRDDIGVYAPAMLSLAVPTHAQSRVIAARPADDEIETIILHPHDDLLDQHPDDPFARGYGRPFRIPSALDVGAEPEQRLSLTPGYAIRRRGAERIEFVLKPSLLLQALVPTPLQFAGDQPVVGIDSVILPSSVRGLETRLLERQFDLSALLAIFASAHLKSRQRRFDAERLNALDHLGGDRGVDAKTAEGDAALRPWLMEAPRQ